ncbi:MAG: transcriptional regulator [Actinomycetaceae bacterium]|nr:transcriptional regulator [Actinomycetaceae bacterium]
MTTKTTTGQPHMAETVTPRIRFRDLKPYDAPVSLDDLCGPYDGLIDLPHSVRWQADRLGVDVSNLGWRRMAYQALLAEGTAEEQCRLINRDRLLDMWPILNMDPRVRDLWERRFSELRAETRSQVRQIH